MENSPAIWSEYFPDPNQTSHKYTRGKLMIYASGNRPGAALLAVRAGRRMGAGIAMMAVPNGYKDFFQMVEIGALVEEYINTASFVTMVEDWQPDAIVIGPGSGINVSIREKIIFCLKSNQKIILDADGISAFSGGLDLLTNNDYTAGNLIMTPHNAEFARLFPKLAEKLTPQHLPNDRIHAALEAAKKIKGIMVLKGSGTIIASSDGRYVVNHEESPFLATAGSGDVLSGMIAGLSAQNMPSFEAAAMSVFIHGRIAKLLGRGLIAEDMSDMIPQILNETLQR